MQMKMLVGSGPSHRIGGRSRAGVAIAQRLAQADGVRKVVIIVVGAGVAPHSADRNAGQSLTAAEQVDVARTAFQRQAGGIEGRGRRPDHCHGFSFERGKVNDVGGMGAQLWRQPRKQRRQTGTAAADDTAGQDDFTRRFGFLRAVDGQVQAEMVASPLDPIEPSGEADRDGKKAPVPGEIPGPVGAADTVEAVIGLGTMPRLIPALKAQARQAEFWTSKTFWCAQPLHPRPREPDAGALSIRRRIDDQHLADAGAAQGKPEGRACPPTADDQDVMVEPVAIRHPVLRIGSQKAQCFARGKIGISLGQGSAPRI